MRWLTHLSRVACVLYIALLWAAVIPANRGPFALTDVSRQLYLNARFLMSRLTLSAGEVIFTGTVGEWKVAANCLKVTGTAATGERRVVYANECPNRSGLRIHNPAFDQVLQEMTRMEIFPPLRRGTRSARRVLDISHYFCHSPLESGTPLRDVEVSQTIQIQSIENGAYFQNTELHCELRCDALPSVVPTCQLRGKPRPLG